MKEKKPFKVNYRLTEDTKVRLDKIAENLGVSASTLVRFALDDYIQKVESEGFLTRPMRRDEAFAQAPVELPEWAKKMSAQELNTFLEEAKRESGEAAAQVAEQPIDDAKLSDRDKAALDAYRRGPVGVIAAGAPANESPVYKLKKKPSKS